MALNTVVLSVIYAECREKVHYAVCHYAECHYAVCYHAVCHYAGCHYAECRGAVIYNCKCTAVASKLRCQY